MRLLNKGPKGPHRADSTVLLSLWDDLAFGNESKVKNRMIFSRIL
jgi:hypothetical protein